MIEDDATVRYAKEQVRRMNKARDFPKGTCPSSRHVAMMAEHLSRSGKYHMLTDEPRHCAGSLASTVASLWDARAKLKELGYCNEGSGWVAAAPAEAQATIARQQVMLDRALEASFDDKARADRAEAEIMPQHVIRVAAALIDTLHVLDTEAVQLADAVNRSGGVDGVQVLEDAEKIIKAAAGFVASELNGVPPASVARAALSRTTKGGAA